MNGIFTVFDISVSSNTTFTATYGTISDSCLVEYCVYVDYGVATEHSNHYYYNSYGSVTVQDNGTKILNTSGTQQFLDLNPIPLDKTVSSGNIYNWNAPLLIEFDIVDCTATSGSGDATVQVYSSTTTGNCYENITIGHWKIELYSNNTQKVYCDNTLKKSTSATLTNARIGLRARSSKYLIYKNFRIRAL